MQWQCICVDICVDIYLRQTSSAATTPPAATSATRRPQTTPTMETAEVSCTQTLYKDDLHIILTSSSSVTSLTSSTCSREDSA